MIWDVPLSELRPASTPERAFFSNCLRGDLEAVKAAAPTLPLDGLLHLVNGLSGFHVSCRKGHVEVVSHLCLARAEVLKARAGDGRTGLMLAAQEGRLGVVELLAGLESQADLRDDRGNSAIHWACFGGSLPCVEKLLEVWPIEVALAKNAEGLSALQVASAGNFPAVVELLVAKLGNDCLGSSSDSGRTALHRAVTHGAVDTIRLFLSKNRAAVDQAATNGQTAIHLACEHGSLAAVILLAEAKADVNARSSAGLTCLHYALIGGHEEVAMHLIRSAGADCLALAESGASALHFAAAANLAYVCRVLFVEHGLDPCTLLDREGRSAVDAARGLGYKELAERLAAWPGLSSAPAAKVLFCGTGHFESGFILTRRALLRDEGVWVLQCAREDVPREITDAHVVVPLMTRITAELLEGASQLRMVMQFGVGLEGVDVPAASKRGVRVCKIPSDSCGNAQSCAEHAVFLSLAVLRDLKGMARSVVTGRLGHPTGRTLLDASVLIVGYGGLGRELAARLVPFGTRRLFVVKRSALSDAEAETDPLVSRGLITLGTLADVLCPVKRFANEASLVILCCTLTDETRGLVNRGFLQCFAPGLAVVNIARGGLIDHAALLEALDSGHVSGAGLDVYHTEPFPLPDQDHLGLIAHPRVVATPHVAGVTEVSYQSMADIVADNVRRLVSGQPLTGAVN